MIVWSRDFDQKGNKQVHLAKARPQGSRKQAQSGRWGQPSKSEGPRQYKRPTRDKEAGEQERYSGQRHPPGGKTPKKIKRRGRTFFGPEVWGEPRTKV